MDMKKNVTINIGKKKAFEIGSGLPLVLIAGPCAIESYDHSMKMAEQIAIICNTLKVN